MIIQPGLLESFIPGDRRRALADGRGIPDRVQGAALFVDISGFTPLTEALAVEFGPQRGAEELTHHLNRIYEAIIDDLAAHQGEVLYFSGDAITCWLDGDDGMRATRCALAMQRTMLEVGGVTTGDETIDLSIKAAVAVGQARRFVVGDPAIQLIDVLAGRLIDQLAAAEQLADPGDVIVEQSALEILGDRVVTSERRVDHDTDRVCGVVDHMVDDAVGQREADPLPSLAPDTISDWLIPGVFDRLTAGAGQFFGELRTAYPIFIRFGGFDYDDDPRALGALDDFIRDMQHVLDRYGGNLLGLTVGDKGAYVFAVFGTPRSHEDDAHRATVAATEISALERSTAARDLQIGVAVGQIYSGTYGHTHRRTFTCLGDPVNLAARLMSAAHPGEIYVTDDVARVTDEWFTWSSLPPLDLKGKVEPVTAHLLRGRRHREIRRHRRYPLPMVGRDRELVSVNQQLERARRGERRVVGLAGEAGIGKSRFVAEILRAADSDGLPVAYGAAEALGRNTSYLAWRGVWRTLFDLDEGASDGRQRELVEQTLATVDPALVQRAPLLDKVVAVDIADNEFTAHFDAKLRKTSLESLLADVLCARLAAGPLLIVLEDCHWIDQPSIDLLISLVRATAELPVLFLLAYRRETDTHVIESFARLPDFDELVLTELDEHGVGEVIDAKTHQVFGPDVTPSTETVELIRDRAQGNPFYAEELVNYMHRLDLDPADPTALADLDLPDSLNAIVLSRVDTLDERPRQALKVASVIGREFDAAMLPSCYPALGTETDVRQQLEALAAADLIVPYDVEQVTWLFRHAITREVAYESIPYSVRAPLHESVGNAIEEAEPESVEFNLDLLAHHYWHSDNRAKKLMFLSRAGEAAQAAYANDAAISHYERLADLDDEADRPETLLKLAKVLELVGDWNRSEEVAGAARELASAARAEVRVGWCEAALAEVSRKQGRYDEAVERLGRAQLAFREHDEEAGEGQVLHLLGTLAAQRGNLDDARMHYEASRVFRERLDDIVGLASLLSNLGVVAEYDGDYEASVDLHGQALELRTAIGDRWAIAVSYTNLGMIAVLEGRFGEARELFADAMQLNTEVGDTWMVAVGHNNLGNAYRGLGDERAARNHYAASAEAYRAYDDRWALAFLFEDIASLAATVSEPIVALELLGAADGLRDEIDAPRPAALEAELTARMDRSLSVIDDATRLEALSRGRGRTLIEAVDHAVAYCRS